ncbi:MAG: PEGA domain-containing protein [Candidatus Peregrinibacteria bacterium]
MDEANKKTRNLIIFIVIVFLLAGIYYLVGFIFSKGEIEITAPAPFTVNIVEGEPITCYSSPCEIPYRLGTYSVIIEKEGYKSLLEEVKFRLLGKNTYEYEFEIIPYIETTDKFPDPTPPASYKLELDPSNHMYKLFNPKDPAKQSLAYFQKEIKNPRIFASDTSALITGTNSAYRVNIKENTRSSITDFDFASISTGLWSPDGNYFIFTLRNSDFLNILDENNSLIQLSLAKEVTRYDWTLSGILTFATTQESTTETDGATSFLPVFSENMLTFATYSPETNTYSTVKSFTDLPLPDLLITASNGKKIYFQIGDQQYVLHH